MKFTALAILPAVLLTLGMFYRYETVTPSVGSVEAMSLGLVWAVTWAILGAYWVARIVRYVMRDR